MLLTNHYKHCKIYRKLYLYYSKIDNDDSFTPNVYDENNHIPFETMREHYKKVYNEYNREVIEYFYANAPDKLFHTNLNDEKKWEKLGDFLNIEVDQQYNTHIKSPVI